MHATLADRDLVIMSTSTLLRATFFALGAAVGGGAVAVLNASKKKEAPSATQVSPPLVEVGITGDPRFSARATTAVGPVLKYGNPGMRTPVSSCLVTHTSTVRRSHPRPTRAPSIRGRV